jgi:SAM-dependent methyltransferase
LIASLTILLNKVILEVSPALLARGHEQVARHNLQPWLKLVEIDLNRWQPEASGYTGAMANHTLHHIAELEQLFASTATALRPHGVFVTNDVIGRNGDMRWPEALRIIEQIWAFLPDRLKFNRRLNRLDAQFVNWDCSTEGFEGVRAQDILRLLIQNFGFTHFFTFGGLVEVFTERSYGHNYDPGDSKDRALIDFIYALNELMIDHGMIKPTLMFAVMTKKGSNAPKYHKHWTPEFSVRTTPSGS